MVKIGIDLGTTNCCVSCFQNGRPEVFENDHGVRTTPSYVAFTNTDVIVGNEAKRHAAIDPSNTVYDAKRLIGRSFSDECTQEDIEHWPFSVIDDNGKPTIEVMYQDETKRFVPEKISSFVLEKLKELAEDKIGETVTDAVITVPAYFNDTQKQATKDAATIAGLRVLKLLNEPTAAAIAFAVNKRHRKRSNVLVYDLGGGTLDVSILSIDNGNIDVIAVNGDTHLGGNDFDNILLDYFLDEIKTKFDKDLRAKGYIRSIERLKQSCELVKIALSAKKRHQSTLEIDALFDGQDYKSVMTRVTFDEICDELMRKTLIPVEKALNDAKLTKDDIDDILLVGGSTRIIKIRDLVKEFFGGKELIKSENPEEAVACGAAIQAALLEDNPVDEISDIKLKDVTPMSYGIEAADTSMSVVIPRNTPYPTMKTKRFNTLSDNQTAVVISIYQGECPFAKDNYFLGQFILSNLPEKKAKEVKVDVTIKIDANGILNVTAVESSTGVAANIKIEAAPGRLSEVAVKMLSAETEEIRGKNLRTKFFNKLIARIAGLNSYLHKKHECSKITKQRVEKFLDKTIMWINDNDDANIDEIEDKLQLVKAHRLMLKSSNDECRTS